MRSPDAASRTFRGGLANVGGAEVGEVVLVQAEISVGSDGGRPPGLLDRAAALERLVPRVPLAQGLRAAVKWPKDL